MGDALPPPTGPETIMAPPTCTGEPILVDTHRDPQGMLLIAHELGDRDGCPWHRIGGPDDRLRRRLRHQ